MNTYVYYILCVYVCYTYTASASDMLVQRDRVLTRELVIENTLLKQHKRRLYTGTSPDGQHRNQIDYILCSQRWRSSI